MNIKVEDSLKKGRYRHYKGGEYELIALATHSETGERLVVYRCLYGDHSWWVRPLEMFVELVEVDGEKKPRFAFIASELDVTDNSRVDKNEN